VSGRDEGVVAIGRKERVEMRRSSELEQLGDRIQQAYRDGDASFLDGITSSEAIVVGTDPSEWTETREQTGEGVRADVASGLEFTVEERRGFEEGDVGWMISRGSFGSGAESVPTRGTAIFHREDGEWRLVHAHASIGVPNSEMFNPALRRSA
jgi:adenylate cyclase